MSLASNAYSLLVARLASLTGISATNMVRVTTMALETLEQRIQETSVVVPFIVLFLDEDRISEYSGIGCQAYETPVRIGYVHSTASSADVQNTIETACETISQGLYGYQTSNGTGSMQILDMPIKNTDMSNEFNAVILGLANGLMAGSVRCKVTYGKI